MSKFLSGLLRLILNLREFLFALLAAILALVITSRFGLLSSKEAFDYLAGDSLSSSFGIIDWLVNSFIVFLALLAFARIIGWLVKRSKTKSDHKEVEEPKYRLLDDFPVSHESSDLLGRSGFVANLSRTVVLPPRANSIVLALEAEWGAGKSSVLFLLEKELAEHPDKPLVIRFNPWVATGRDRIFRAFFSQFSASLLGAGQRQAAANLVAFGEALEDLIPSGARVFPRLGFWRVRKLIGGIPVVDLEKHKDSIIERVTSAGRPIVVVIDDIDRLPPEDIKVVFQLIKAIAAFPRVAYLLAFDPEPVDLALSHDGDIQKGRQFRDKIIQASITLPKIEFRQRELYMRGLLEERLSLWKIQLKNYESELLEQAIPLALTALLTPRDTKRAINAALMKAEPLRGEVNFADVLIFETLHSKFPMIANAIRQKPEEVNPSGASESDPPDSILPAVRKISEKKSNTERLDDFVDGVEGGKEVPKALLRFLFPTVFSEPSGADENYVASLRVADHENLLKLLFLGAGTRMLKATEAREVLRDSDTRMRFFSDQIETGAFPVWLRYLRNFIGHDALEDPDRLAEQVMTAVNTYHEEYGVDVASESRWLLLDLVRLIEPEKRPYFLKSVLARAEFAAVGEVLLVSLLNEHGLWFRGDYRPENEMDSQAIGLSNILSVLSVIPRSRVPC